MKKLESMYTKIFQDEKLQELFLNFHSIKWKVLTKEEKINIMEEINQRVADIYGYKAPEIVKMGANSNNDGSFVNFYWEINLNPELFEKYNGYQNIDTYFHELRHSLQYRFIENQLTEKEHLDPKYKPLWQENFLPGNYFDGESPFYLYQPVEADAWKTGVLFARGVYLLCLKHYKIEDLEWKKYCSMRKHVIVNFISDNPESKEQLDEINRRIKEIYSQRKIDAKQVNLGKEYTKKYISKGIENLDFKEVLILLSPYAFTYLDIDQKVELLNKYEKYIRVGRKSIKIERNTLGSIKINNHLVSPTDSIGIVNDLLSIEFEYIVNYILKGTKIDYNVDCNAKKELMLNLYKDENKVKINYVHDYDNLFLFSLQPYARYKSKYVLEQFKKMEDIELSTYGKNYDNWDTWKDFYDNSKIYKMAQSITDCKFSNYYLNQLKVYKERIDLSKQNKLQINKKTIAKDIQISIYDKMHKNDNKETKIVKKETKK